MAAWATGRKNPKMDASVSDISLLWITELRKEYHILCVPAKKDVPFPLYERRLFGMMFPVARKYSFSALFSWLKPYFPRRFGGSFDSSSEWKSTSRPDCRRFPSSAWVTPRYKKAANGFVPPSGIRGSPFRKNASRSIWLPPKSARPDRDSISPSPLESWPKSADWRKAPSRE